jgi:hypothetical protein
MPPAFAVPPKIHSPEAEMQTPEPLVVPVP